MQLFGLKVFTGNSNPEFAKKVCAELDIPLGNAEVKRFSDGESFVRIGENVRGADVFVIQSTCYPTNDNLMELLVMVDAFKRSSAERITAIIPYYGYARQDRKDSPRTPITAKLVADLLTAAGVNRVFSLDLHAPQIQGFFNIPVDHLFAAPVLLKYVRDYHKGNTKNLVVVSPDAGGVERVRAFAKRLECSIAIIDKRREKANEAQIVNVVGDVEGKPAVLVDDMCDTGGTITQAADVLLKKGATEVYAVATHAVLSGPAIQRINDSKLSQIVLTDTIPLNGKDKTCRKLVILSVAPLVAEAIIRIHNSDSISSLFTN